MQAIRCPKCNSKLIEIMDCEDNQSLAAVKLNIHCKKCKDNLLITIARKTVNDIIIDSYVN